MSNRYDDYSVEIEWNPETDPDFEERAEDIQDEIEEKFPGIQVDFTVNEGAPHGNVNACGPDKEVVEKIKGKAKDIFNNP